MTCAEFEAVIVNAKTWDETRQAMQAYHKWFSARYRWNDESKKWEAVTTALVLVGPKWEFDGFYDDWFAVLMYWTMWYVETTPSSVVLREHKMRYIRWVLELLENEQLTVDEAEWYIKAIMEGGEPVLPEGTGKLRICEKCGKRMSGHDSFNRCPVPCPKCGVSLTKHSLFTDRCPCARCNSTQCICKGKEATAACASSE